MRGISITIGCLITFLLIFAEAAAQTEDGLLPLTTQSDSAKHFYYLGWQQIMDYGDYTAAERSYRKSVAYDPDFILGHSLVGRISSDYKERIKLLHLIEERKHETTPDEALVIDFSCRLMEFLNARDELDSTKMAEKLKVALLTGLQNVGLIGQKYPNEIYYIAEYFEVMNYLYGPQKTLDTLRAYNASYKKPAPFLIGYESTLEADLGNYDNALELAFKLKKCLKDKKVPKPYAVLGDIYLKKGDLEKANKYINKALELDAGNRAVQRLKKRADQLAQSQIN